MKKLLLAGVAGLVIVALAGCKFADGVDREFGDKAVAIFVEIDDDTMAGELSDKDDIANFDLLTVEASTEREVNAVQAVEGIVKLQDKVINGDREALKEYLKARQGFLNALGIASEDERSYHGVPDFAFYEEE